jgi:hypothetical protein
MDTTLHPRTRHSRLHCPPTTVPSRASEDIPLLEATDNRELRDLLGGLWSGTRGRSAAM